MEGQLSIFGLLKPEEPERKPGRILSVGDKIGRVVLGECQIATVTKVEGNGRYMFYRTDRTCYSLEEGYRDIDDLIAEAERERAKYKTIIPENLADRLTVEYEPRECDGKILWAQIGIIGNMLFWKESMTYQFLEPYDNEKKLRKEYEKHKKKILEESYQKYRILGEEKPMHRLYWSKHGFYADAEYAEHNG